VLAAVALVVFRDFVLGQSTYLFKDIGSDTLNVFYPSFVLVAKLLRHGLPGWSFAQGMGQDVFPNSVGDPFNDLLYLLGPDRLAYGIAIVELLKLLMAGALFYVLLQLRGKTGFTSALGALGFAFCGSIIVGGTWYVFSTNVVQAAFLLVGFELLFQRRNRWLFPLSVAFAVSSSAFNLYVFGILLVVYAVLRWFDGESAADGQRARWSVPALAGWTVALGIVGVAISAVLVLPSAWELLHSPRGQGETLLPHQLRSYPVLGFGGAHYYASVALRLFGNDLLGPGKDFQGWQNYLEAPMHYSGLLALLLAPQAFAVMRGRARIAWAVVTALGVALHVFPWPRFAFWLFTGDYFRTLSLFVTLLLLALATRALDAIVRKGALRTSLLASTLIVLLVLLFWPWYPAGTPPRIDADLRAGVALLLVIECCCVLALARPSLRLTAQVATLAVVTLEVAVLAGISLAGRNAVSTAELHQRSGYNDGTAEAIERIRRVDPGFFRVQKNYSSSPAVLHASINDAKVQGYYSTSSYSSFNQPNYIKFLVEVGIVDPTMELSSRWAEGLRQRPILQTFASVRYWLVKGDWQKVGFLAATYDVADSVPGITVLRNRNFIPLGFATTAGRARERVPRARPDAQGRRTAAVRGRPGRGGRALRRARPLDARFRADAVHQQRLRERCAPRRRARTEAARRRGQHGGGPHRGRGAERARAHDSVRSGLARDCWTGNPRRSSASTSVSPGCCWRRGRTTSGSSIARRCSPPGPGSASPASSRGSCSSVRRPCAARAPRRPLRRDLATRERVG
jgi:uncharacterized membrane protein YidH (DUF202 family)